MARRERLPQPQLPPRPGLLDVFTTGVGAAWALLAAFKYFAGPFAPAAQQMNLLPVYYLCLALAAVHLADSVRSRDA